jgi:hypothetical protein
MKHDFSNLFIIREQALRIEQVMDKRKTKCWFAGDYFVEKENAKYIHFITFSKECFSTKKYQQNLSIFVNPDSGLPTWFACGYEDISFLENVLEFNLGANIIIANENGTKIGGNPYYIRGAQAYLFEKSLVSEGAQYILELDYEDFFPIRISGIDKARRDILCGGAIYLYAKVNEKDQTIDFSTCWIDHQI